MWEGGGGFWGCWFPDWTGMKVPGVFWEGFLKIRGRFLEASEKVLGRFVEGSWKVLRRFLEGSGGEVFGKVLGGLL